MQLTVNGEPVTVPDGTTVAALVAGRSGTGRSTFGVAVARNGEVVPRTIWEATMLTEADVVELLGATAGG